MANNTTTSAWTLDNLLHASADAIDDLLAQVTEPTNWVWANLPAELRAAAASAGESNNAQPAEPVAFVDERAGSGGISRRPGFRELQHGTPLFATAAPVVPDEITDDEKEAVAGECWADSFRGGWNACRAAMLKSLSGTETAPALCSDIKTGESRCSNHIERTLEMVNSPAIPDGWKLVPENATTEMVRAGAAAARKYMLETGGNSPRVIYKAMIAEAPAQEDN